MAQICSVISNHGLAIARGMEEGVTSQRLERGDENLEREEALTKAVVSLVRSSGVLFKIQQSFSSVGIPFPKTVAYGLVGVNVLASAIFHITYQGSWIKKSSKTHSFKEVKKVASWTTSSYFKQSMEWLRWKIEPEPFFIHGTYYYDRIEPHKDSYQLVNLLYGWHTKINPVWIIDRIQCFCDVQNNPVRVLTKLVTVDVLNKCSEWVEKNEIAKEILAIGRMVLCKYGKMYFMYCNYQEGRYATFTCDALNDICELGRNFGFKSNQSIEE